MNHYTRKKKKPSTTRITNAMLTYRDYKPILDKPQLHRLISQTRYDYYITVYKRTFRSLFTYVLTATLLAISLTLIRSNLYAVLAPPLLVTAALLWRVNAYKRANRLLTVHDMEMLNECENEPHYKFKSNESRRRHQGVLVAFVDEAEKKKKTLEELDLEDLDESDLNLEDSDEEENDKKVKKEKKLILVGYLVYGKQMDEMETVAIKELCVSGEYRRRGVAACFVKRVARELFAEWGYRRVTFQASTFHEAMMAICERVPFITKIYTWTAYQFLPGVFDHRHVYGVDLNQLIGDVSSS